MHKDSLMPKIALICIECQQQFWQWPSVVKRTGSKFCSNSCSVRHRNRINGNPAKRPEVRAKIAANHACVSGELNPMYGVRGERAPAFIDGRNAFGGGWHGKALANKPWACQRCGDVPVGRRLHVHHLDGDHGNDDLENLEILCVACHNNLAHPRGRNSLGQFQGGRGQ